MKDKAEILLQVDESQSIKNELTIQVRETVYKTGILSCALVLNYETWLKNIAIDTARKSYNLVNTQYNIQMPYYRIVHLKPI